VRVPVYIYSEYMIFIGNRRASVTFTTDPYRRKCRGINSCLFEGRYTEKNNFTEGSKILLDANLKIILLES